MLIIISVIIIKGQAFLRHHSSDCRWLHSANAAISADVIQETDGITLEQCLTWCLKIYLKSSICLSVEFHYDTLSCKLKNGNSVTHLEEAVTDAIMYEIYCGEYSKHFYL